jgi:uncharacterized protein
VTVISLARTLAVLVLASVATWQPHATGQANAGPLEDAAVAAQRGDHATAVQLWLPLAEHGEARAQFNLGFAYDSGHGVPQNFAEAAKWYRLAAQQGHAVAQHNLGVSYETGQGVPQDFAEAAKWFRLAAEQRIAAAQFNLGALYFAGKGVPRDDVQAYTWLSLAASLFPASQKERRDATIYIRDTFVAANMTGAQIAEAERLTRDWKPNTAF